MICFALLCFALLCFALLCFAYRACFLFFFARWIAALDEACHETWRNDCCGRKVTIVLFNLLPKSEMQNCANSACYFYQCFWAFARNLDCIFQKSVLTCSGVVLK
jgi:hypothetical protein